MVRLYLVFAFSFTVVILIGLWGRGFDTLVYPRWGLNRGVAVTRNTPVVEERAKVLIVTYMRSGSTFLGSMFLANQEAFYVFEPLNEARVERSKGEKMQILNDIMDCHFERLPASCLTKVVWNYGTEGEVYFECTRRAEQDGVKKCLHHLLQPCLRRHATVIKATQIRMRSAEVMLNIDPNLRIINMVRDPRPTLNSRDIWMSISAYDNRTFSEKVKDFCDEVYHDVVITQRLATTHPDRVKFVYYEDMVVNTEEKVRDLYKFVGIPFSVDILNHIRKLSVSMQTKPDPTCLTCITGRNGSEQLVKWRHTMEYEKIKMVDESCHQVYDVLGYLPVASERQLRDVRTLTRRAS